MPTMRFLLGRRESVAQCMGRRIASWFICAAIGVLASAAQAQGASCIQSANSQDGAPMRVAPRQDAAEIERLRGQAPLTAIMPRWYETRTTDGRSAFVSKQSANITPCVAAAAAPITYELHAIDVGTGLAIFVRGPNFSLLFDAGTNDDLARGANNRVLAYLRTLTPAVMRINHVFLSHPHRDHVELLPDIFGAVVVENVWNSGAYNNICGYRAFLKAIAQENGVQYHTATWDAGVESVLLPKKTCYGVAEPQRTINVPHGDRITDAPVASGLGASMRILHADGSDRPSFNENSLVVRLDLGPYRILLTGDAEAGGRKSPTVLPTAHSIEGKLLACCIDELKADVLVAGHHGSKTSSRSAFLDAVAAKLFIVSSGPTKYATVTLPDDEVISEFESRGEVFRTDIDDDQCAIADDKVGPDNDGKPGGCSNIILSLPTVGAISVEYQQAE